MEQITLTAKIQIVVADTNKVLLDETMSVYRDACNYVSDYVFRTHDLKQFSHQVSKALVENNPKHTLFVLEDLSGIRNATECINIKDRYVSVSWSFYDLEQKLIYKAKQNQPSVIKGRRYKPLLRLGSYKPMTFRSWIVDKNRNIVMLYKALASNRG